MLYEKTELEAMSTAELQALLAKSETEVAKGNIMQLGIKVTLNSAYGMIGNEFSRYFDTRIAEAITISGQLSIRWIERKLEEYLSKICRVDDQSFVIAGDTDSMYLTLGTLVDKYMAGATKQQTVKAIDKICKEKIEPFIDEAYQELAEYMNAYDQKMVMKREVIADRGIWRAKKNYALNVWDSEGVAYDEPQVKVKGLEAVRSSTPEMCRDAIKKTLKLILNEDEAVVQKYVAEFKAAFYSAPLDSIARNSGVKDLEKWRQDAGFISGTPYHVKASMVYNRMLVSLGLTGKYQPIRSGDKVKLIYLKKANPTHNNVIAYPDALPPEFELDRYIDKKIQYSKNYLEPVESLLDIVGWTSEVKNTLW